MFTSLQKKSISPLSSKLPSSELQNTEEKRSLVNYRQRRYLFVFLFQTARLVADTEPAGSRVATGAEPPPSPPSRETGPVELASKTIENNFKKWKFCLIIFFSLTSFKRLDLWNQRQKITRNHKKWKFLYKYFFSDQFKNTGDWTCGISVKKKYQKQ